MSTPDLPAIARETAEKIHRLHYTEATEARFGQIILAALTEATEKSREDSERLDWLLHRYSYADGRTDATRLHWGLSGHGRQAIDAARRAGK